MELTMVEAAPSPANGRKRKSPLTSSLGDLHDDMLERVLARLPPASYFRLRAVCRRWSAAAASPTFLDACARVPSRDPWFLMLTGSDGVGPVVAFDAADRGWNHCRVSPGFMPVAASGGLVLCRSPARGALTVANPLTGASRALLPPPQQDGQPLQAVAMYGAARYRVALFTGELPHLSMAVFDSSSDSWEGPVSLVRRSEDSWCLDAPVAGLHSPARGVPATRVKWMVGSTEK
jgi:hypothetical protein